MEQFEHKIGYSFKDKSILTQALTHSSYANEDKGTRKNNERLEFLGDSVLSLIVSNHLYRKFPDLPEGELTKIRSSLVCDKSLASFAKQIGLGDYLFVGKGEEMSGGRNRMSTLEDAFEALIGAIYLDGGFGFARKFVLKFIEDFQFTKNSISFDYKTALQEIIQQNPEEKVYYELVSETGPDHNKRFEVVVKMNSNVIGKGRGKSKKQAEQAAAKQALELMGHET